MKKIIVKNAHFVILAFAAFGAFRLAVFRFAHPGLTETQIFLANWKLEALVLGVAFGLLLTVYLIGERHS